MASKEEEVIIPPSLQECFPTEPVVEKMVAQPPWVPADVLEGTKKNNDVAQIKMEVSPACGNAQWKDATEVEEISHSELKNPQLQDPYCWDDIFPASVEKATNPKPEKWMAQFMPGLKEDAQLEDRDVGDYGKAAELFEVASVASPKADGLPLDPDQKQLCLEIKEENLLDDGNSLDDSHTSESNVGINHPNKNETEEPHKASVVSVETFPLLCKEGVASNGQMLQKTRGKPPQKRMRKSIPLAEGYKDLHEASTEEEAQEGIIRR
uniref:Uncharacterized protein n=1 Tax=Sphaerodactylus townsendi TaxID=933632 RepID=A0ACB8EF90_9SAUR